MTVNIAIFLFVISVALLVGAVLFMKPQVFFYAFIASLPLEGLISDDFLSIPKILGLLAIIAWLFFSLKSKSKIFIDKTSCFIFLFTLFASLSLMWTIDTESTISSIVTFVLLAFLYLMTINSVTSAEEIYWTMMALMACGVLLVVYGLFLMATGGLLISGRYYGLMGNPNYTALWSIATLPGFYYIFKTSRSTIIRGFIFCSVVVLLYFFIFTLSRGGVISLLLFLTVPLYFMFRKSKIILAIVLVATLFYAVAPDELWVRFANLGAEDQRDGARLESLWPAGLRAWENSPLIGYGLGTNSLIIQRAIGADTPVHSAPLAVAMELGVIGLALYLLFLIAPVSKAIKNLFEAKRLHKADSNVFTQLNIWMMAAMASIMVTWFKGSGMECSKLLFLFLGIIMALNQKRLLILYKPK